MPAGLRSFSQLVGMGTLVFAACGSPQASEVEGCLSRLPRANLGECTPRYEAAFSEVHRNTISASCAVGYGCHGTQAPVPALALFGGAEASYAALVGGHLVVPGDPECSPLMARLESSDAAFRMPFGGELGESERCAITQWIADGAQP